MLGFNLHPVLAHLIGDYLLQNDWMANGKKNSNKICTVHVVLYLIPFVFCNITPVQILLIGLQHWIQDRYNFVVWYMNITGKKQFSQPPLAPWGIFVVDNIFHVLWIYLVISYL